MAHLTCKNLPFPLSNDTGSVFNDDLTRMKKKERRSALICFKNQDILIGAMTSRKHDTNSLTFSLPSKFFRPSMVLDVNMSAVRRFSSIENTAKDECLWESVRAWVQCWKIWRADSLEIPLLLNPICYTGYSDFIKGRALWNWFSFAQLPPMTEEWPAGWLVPSAESWHHRPATIPTRWTSIQVEYYIIQQLPYIYICICQQEKEADQANDKGGSNFTKAATSNKYGIHLRSDRAPRD